MCREAVPECVRVNAGDSRALGALDYDSEDLSPGERRLWVDAAFNLNVATRNFSGQKCFQCEPGALASRYLVVAETNGPHLPLAVRGCDSPEAPPTAVTVAGDTALLDRFHIAIE